MTTTPTAPGRHLLSVTTALIVLLVLGGCGDKDKDTVETKTPSPVCGLVDPALAAEVVGSDEFSTNGPGAIPRKDRNSSGAHCTIRRDSGAGPRIQVRLGEVASPEEWADKLRAEAKDVTYGDPVATYTDDPGVGYGITYEDGIFALGAGVNVLKGDRVIRVTVYQWPDVTPERRLEAAVKIARDADANLTAYDREHS